MKVLTLFVNLHSSTVIVFIMLVNNSFPFSSFIRGSIGVNVVSVVVVVVPRCVFPLKFFTLRFILFHSFVLWSTL